MGRLKLKSFGCLLNIMLLYIVFIFPWVKLDISMTCLFTVTSVWPSLVSWTLVNIKGTSILEDFISSDQLRFSAMIHPDESRRLGKKRNKWAVKKQQVLIRLPSITGMMIFTCFTPIIPFKRSYTGMECFGVISVALSWSLLKNKLMGNMNHATTSFARWFGFGIRNTMGMWGPNFK